MGSKGSEEQRGIFPRYGTSEDVDRELRSHIEMRAEELIASGWESAAARAEALRLFGDRSAVAAACEGIARKHRRKVGRMEMIEAFWSDVRYGIRTLVRSPGFALVAVLTLALGIGANTAIFSVVNGVLLRPLPFDDPEGIVWVRETSNRGGTMSVAWPNFRDWRDQVNGLDGLVAYSAWSTTVLGGREPVQASVANVTNDFWSIFGIVPLQGRTTLVDDHQESAEPVVVVARGFWENQLAGIAFDAVILELNGVRARVVGVAEDPNFLGNVDVWAPLELSSPSGDRTAHNWDVVGRLAQGVSIEQARQELDALTKVIVQDASGADPDFLATGASVVRLQEELVGDTRTSLLLLLGAAGLVLLVACTNLASTFLARGAARSREFAVRMSLGAPKLRVVRQLLTESIVIASAGAVAGVAMAAAVMRTLQAVGANSVPRLSEISIDGWVLGYTGAIALLTAFLFGLVPAMRLTSDQTGSALRSGSRGNALEAQSGIWRLLVGTEVALALVLLVATGLLVRSSRALLTEEVGVDVTDVNTATIALSRLKYESGYEQARWYDELITTLEADPGVQTAGVMSILPVSGSLPDGRLEVDGDPAMSTTAGYIVASGGAFEALDIPLLRGRLFDAGDTEDAGHVAIVSRSFADAVWPEQDPIGRQVNGGGMDDFWEERTFARVVGVVGDVRFRDLSREAGPTVYFPHSQRPFRLQFAASVVAEAALGDAPSTTRILRETIGSLDADVPLRLRTMNDLVRASVAGRRFVMLLFGAFSIIALVLAAVGIYGVVSYSVARRTREMGIRLALGADGGHVRGMVVMASMRMALVGLVFGVVGAVGLSRVMVDLLYGVSPTDPLTLFSVVVVLAGTALVASWIPAWAGTRVDPMVTMRAD